MLNVGEKRSMTGEKLFNFRPILFIAIALTLGVVAGFYSLVFENWVIFYIFLIVAIGLLLLSKGKFFFFAVILLAFAMGVFLFSAQKNSAKIEGFVAGRYELKGYVSEMEAGDDKGFIRLSELSIGGKEYRGKLQIYLDGKMRVKVGDVVRCTADISKINSNKVQSYTYGTLASEVYFTAKNVEDFEVLDSRFDLFDFLRNRLKDRLYLGMDEEPASVLYAILTGDTMMIEAGLLKNVRYGGIAHIFAVSGLHIGALYGFCIWVVSKLTKSKNSYLRLILPTALLLFYGGFCGFSSSITRAIVMCLTLGITEFFGFKGDGLERISLALIFVLILNPVALFTVGFLLSFTACFSIVLFMRPIQDALIKVREKNLFLQKLVDLIAVSLSAQIGTLPILLYYFGYFSVWALLLNLLFVPLISISFALLLGLSVLAMLLPKGAVALLLYLPSALFSGCLLLFHAVDFSALSWEGEWSKYSMIAYYFLPLAWTDKLNAKRKGRWIFTAIALCLFAVGCFL